MEITGKVIQILPAETGTSARGEWQKQQFVIETEDEFPKKIALLVWNKKIALDNLEGSKVKVGIEIQSREYNQRWYTDVMARSLELMESPSQASPPAPANENNPDPLADPQEEEMDDLPF
jgi:hypothetical protein